MHFTIIDLEDLIAMSGVCDLKPTMPRVILTSPSWTKDSGCLMMSLIKFLLLPPVHIVWPLLLRFLKKRKLSETSSSHIKAIDLDDFKFDEVILKDVMVLNSLITYFDEGNFGWSNLIRDLYSSFGSEVEQAKVKEAHKEEKGIYWGADD